MRTAILVATGLVALTAGIAVMADQKADEKFCAIVAAFDSDVAEMKAMGPHSTVAELRAATDRLDKDMSQMQKAADKMKTPAAKQFTDAMKQLKQDVKNVPDEATLGQVRAKINADEQNAQKAARQLAAESGCPEKAPEVTPPQP